MALNLFELSAKITLDTTEYEKGLRAGEKSFKKFGDGLNGVLKKAAAVSAKIAVAGGTAFAKLTAAAFKQASSYEQLLGGVETLFKSSSKKVEQYAAVAYKTAGMSANEYMETVTSFSASLLQSLGGDTSKAADVADMAIQDMSDNANKMGTSMESIQAAYQGFAKQNYTMLDNLKLGYGGTKTEMERLLSDASKLTGKKYNLDNLADVYEAIHAIQKEMGITGSTADEASKTIEGSWKAVGAAFQNFLSGNGGAEGGYQALISSLDTALDLSIERLGRIVPRLAQQGGEILKKLGDKIPALMETLMPAVETGLSALLESLGDVLPYLISSAANLLPSLITGVSKLISNLAAKMPQILNSVWTAIKGVFKKLSERDNPLLQALAGAFTAISDAVAAIGNKESTSMSSKSNDQGRAYEYITLETLFSEISNVRKAKIVKNSSYYAAKSAWENMTANFQNLLTISARSFVPDIFDLEPLILEDEDDVVELLIQQDGRGEEGDVRDILIIRNGIEWEIGLSMKHNHFAVKHSRLSHTIDFGEKWYGYKCSEQYWNQTLPLFRRLESLRASGVKWEEVPNKHDDIYVPILKAFIEEVKKACALHKDLPGKMTEYLLGEYDFYKVISIDHEKTTRVNAFNLRGTLNNDGKNRKAKRRIPKTLLPTRIVSLDFKPNSKTTVELYMDNGWQFSFRIHSADSIVQNSLKFDIQSIGMPSTIVTINCRWK